MSIILKALKKAEESKPGKDIAEEKSHAYRLNDKKALWIIIAGFAGLVLVFFLGINWYRSRPVSKTPAMTADRVTPVQSSDVRKTVEKAVSDVTEIPDAERLNKDAIRMIKERDYAGAEGILRKALLAKPDDAELHNNLGFGLKKQGRYREAESEYEKAIKLRRDYYEAMNNLAVVCEVLGEQERAKIFYKKALSIKPSYAEAHLNYALLLEAEGNDSEAESHYYTFLNLSPDEALKSKVKERLQALKKHR